MHDQDLKHLFSRIAGGDVAAFDSVFNSYYDEIYSTALVYGKTHDLAQDVVQQVFMKLWERRQSLTEVTNPEGWLHTAARYTVKDALEKEMVRESYRKQVLQTITQENNSPAEILIKAERRELIRSVVNALPPRQLEIYQLSREEGLTYEEIAKQLGIGRETVKDHMGKALKTIHTLLKQNRDKLMYWIIFFISRL